MYELSNSELEVVNGGIGILTIPSALGLLVSIPTIVGGAIAGVPTGGLGFVAMTAGIVGTALSGVGLLASIIF